MFEVFGTQYELYLSLMMVAGIIACRYIVGPILSKFGGFKGISQLNKAVVDEMSKKPFWVDNQKKNRRWGGVFFVIIFLTVIPFVITNESMPWWHFFTDAFVILMIYDFIYYLTHRFLFHDGGPLVWMHAIHHQMKNPCRMDASYIHPLEVAIGLSLYVGTVFVLSYPMGDFHILTLLFTWMIFSEVNQHNHDRQENDKFPFRYLKYAADMHHVHHSRFTSGNYATISLFYDWLFGTLDNGQGWKRKV